MATFRVRIEAVESDGTVQAKSHATEFQIPDDLLRQYRTYVTPQIVAAMTKASVIILSADGDMAARGKSLCDVTCCDAAKALS